MLFLEREIEENNLLSCLITSAFRQYLHWRIPSFFNYDKSGSVIALTMSSSIL